MSSDGYELEAFDGEQIKIDKEIKGIPDFLPNLKDKLDPKGWLEIGKVRGRENLRKQDELRQSVIGIATGQAEEEIRNELKTTETRMFELIDSLGKTFTVPTERTMREEIDNDILSMERSLSSGEYSKHTNPKTNQPYTQEEWASAIKQAKDTRYIEAGLGYDVYEAGGTILAQLLNPGQADALASVPEQLRKQRFERSQDYAVRKWQADREKTTAMINALSKKHTDLRDLYQNELAYRERREQAIFENSEALKRLNVQITNGNWEIATKEANNIIQNLKNVPPEQIESMMARYNNLASFANSLNDLGMKVYGPDEIKAVKLEAAKRERQTIITQVVNQMLIQRNNWETATDEDIQKFNDYLRAFGPQFDPNNPDMPRVLTVNDLGIVTAFNRLKPKTEEEIRSNKKNEELRGNSNEETKRHNQETESIARDKGTSTNTGKLAGLQSVVDNKRKALDEYIDGLAKSGLIKKGFWSGVFNKAGNNTDKIAQAKRVMDGLKGYQADKNKEQIKEFQRLYKEYTTAQTVYDKEKATQNAKTTGDGEFKFVGSRDK